jgi:hypothetical protein
MLIQLKQADIESAIRAYVTKMGIARPVTGVEFTTNRKGGFSILAEVTVSDTTVEETTAPIPTGPIPRAAQQVVTPVEPVVTEPVEEPAVEEVTPPFAVDTVAENDPVAPEEIPVVPSTRSLFGG